MRSSIVSNLGVSGPLWYITMYFGSSCPMEYSLVGAEGSHRVSESSSEVSTSVDLSIGGTGS